MTETKNFLRNSSYLGTTNDLVSNLVQGGQLGYGFKAGALDASTPLVFPPAVICVLQTPTMWDDMPADPEGILRQTVKAMFECHAKSVSGIEINYTVDQGEQPIGHDGQNLSVPLQTKRQAVTPSFTYPEVTGNLVWNLHRRWIWDMSDPDTNAGLEHQGPTPSPYTMTTYSLTFMAIEFDPTQAPERIIDAAVYTNVWPTTTTELGMQREIGTSQVKERAITYAGYIMHNDRTRDLGISIATQLALRSETYKTASPNTEQISPLVNSRDGDRGIIDDPDLAKTGGDSWNKKDPSL